MLHQVASANARALGRLAGGDVLWPLDWIDIVSNNLAAATALSGLQITPAYQQRRQPGRQRQRKATPRVGNSSRRGLGAAGRED